MGVLIRKSRGNGGGRQNLDTWTAGIITQSTESVISVLEMGAFLLFVYLASAKLILQSALKGI